MKTIKQKVVIQSSDSVTFILKVEEAIIKGARIDQAESQRITQFPYRAVMKVEGPADKFDWYFESDAYTTAWPVPDSDKVFSKEYLDKLEWDELRVLLKESFGISGRDRTLIITRYLQSLEESQ